MCYRLPAPLANCSLPGDLRAHLADMRHTLSQRQARLHAVGAEKKLAEAQLSYAKKTTLSLAMQASGKGMSFAHDHPRQTIVA